MVSHYWLSCTIQADAIVWGDENENRKANLAAEQEQALMDLNLSGS
jgi:hypothetical protein